MNNPVVIITGASSGIGAACAHIFAQSGYAVSLAARNINKLQKVAQSINLPDEKCILTEADVSIAADCKKIIDNTLNTFGRIDVLINNAGITMRALFANTDVAVIKQVMDINFWGTVYCTKYALPYILKQSGSIIGISSVAGFIGLPARTGYSASKFAMQGFLQALRNENLKNNIHIGIVAPGYTASNIRNTALNATGQSQHESPLNENKLMPAEQVAKYILNCVIKRKNMVVLTTQGKLAFWLSKFFPRLADWLTYKTIKKEKDSPF